MKKILLILLAAFGFSSVKAQVVTVTGGSNTTPTLSSSYVSLASAINDLNSISSISGLVTITLNASEVAPAGWRI